MTDDPALTPEQETRVRRLLSDARNTEPLPQDVAARLDRVLAQLAVGASDDPAYDPAYDTADDRTGDTGRVVSLAARRRRRVASLLVAAAAVVVVGIGLGQLMGGPDQAADTASTNAGSTQRDAPEAPEAVDGQTPAPTYAFKVPVPIRPDRFSHDVTRLQHLTFDGGSLTPAPQSGSTRNGADLVAGGFGCSPGAWGLGTFVPVVYGGEPAVLVLRRVTGDTQVVDLFQCGSSEPLRSITLPAP